MNTFTLTITSPYKTIYSGGCAMLSATSPDGRFGIMANHAPILAALAPCTIDLVKPDNSHLELDITSGLLEFDKNSCVVTIIQNEEAAGE